jgi:acyl carrier protein
MVPAAFVTLESLPLTPNGKVDRARLPTPPDRSSEMTYSAPRTAIEQLLAEIWAKLLRVERVGVHDNFFDLGGHSLLATSVMSRVRARAGVELPLRTLFDVPVLADFARRVDAVRRLVESARDSSGAPDEECEEGVI